MSNGSPKPSPISTPKPPAPPVPPASSNPSLTDPKLVALDLVKLIRDKTVIIDLSIIPTATLAKVEQALFQELSNYELQKYGYELRRMVRFELAQRSGLLAPKKPDTFPVERSIKEKEVVRLDASRTITLRRHNDVYTITLDGSKVGAHWIQFIW